MAASRKAVTITAIALVGLGAMAPASYAAENQANAHHVVKGAETRAPSYYVHVKNDTNVNITLETFGGRMEGELPKHGRVLKPGETLTYTAEYAFLGGGNGNATFTSWYSDALPGSFAKFWVEGDMGFGTSSRWTDFRGFGAVKAEKSGNSANVYAALTGKV